MDATTNIHDARADIKGSTKNGVAGRCNQSAKTSPTNLESQQWNVLQNSRMITIT
jgi:hypothetical protein